MHLPKHRHFENLGRRLQRNRIDLAADSRGEWKADLRCDREASIAPCLKAAGQREHVRDRPPFSAAPASLTPGILFFLTSKTPSRSASQRSAIPIRRRTVVTNELSQALTALGAEMSQEMRHEPSSQDSAHGSVRFHVAVEGEPRDLHPILRDEVYAIRTGRMNTHRPRSARGPRRVTNDRRSQPTDSQT
jgi:hypothetical protein